MATFYYTVDPDIMKSENFVNVYYIENNYPYYLSTLIIPFGEDLTGYINSFLEDEKYENFEISRL